MATVDKTCAGLIATMCHAISLSAAQRATTVITVLVTILPTAATITIAYFKAVYNNNFIIPQIYKTIIYPQVQVSYDLETHPPKSNTWKTSRPQNISKIQIGKTAARCIAYCSLVLHIARYCRASCLSVHLSVPVRPWVVIA